MQLGHVLVSGSSLCACPYSFFFFLKKKKSLQKRHQNAQKYATQGTEESVAGLDCRQRSVPGVYPISTLPREDRSPLWSLATAASTLLVLTDEHRLRVECGSLATCVGGRCHQVAHVCFNSDLYTSQRYSMSCYYPSSMAPNRTATV